MNYPTPVKHKGRPGQPLSDQDLKDRLEWIRQFIALNGGVRPKFSDMSTGWDVSVAAVSNTIDKFEQLGWIKYEYQNGIRRRGTLQLKEGQAMKDLSHFDLPKVTIVINTYNRPRSLGILLKHLSEQAHTNWADVEIVVVNDGSHNEAYQAVIERHSNQCSLKYHNIQRREDDRPQLYTLKNFGVDQSTFKEVVWLLDDDLMFDDHTLFVMRLYHMFLADSRPVVYPHYADAREPHHYQAPFDFQPQPVDWDKTRHWPAFAGMSIRYEDWQAVGGVDEIFDTAMGFADLELGIRLWQDGCQIILADGMCCFIDDRETGSHRDRFLFDHRNGKLFMEKVGLEMAAKYGITP